MKDLIRFTSLQWLLLITWTLVHLILLARDWDNTYKATSYFWPFQRHYSGSSDYDFTEFLVYVGGGWIAVMAVNYLNREAQKPDASSTPSR